jgi:carboxypeptidase C (cathepsin A)
MPDKDKKKPKEKPEAKPEVSKAEEKEEKPAPKDNLVVTQHQVRIGGREIKYTVTAGTIVLKEEPADREKEWEGEKPRAQIFFIAYTKDSNGTKSKEKTSTLAERPLTFSFNGGPGSSSVWLHLGVLGPRRVVLTDEGELPPPPFRLTDNEYSLLDETDLVFIDPVSTGYSRTTDGQKPKEWHEFRKDIESVGDFHPPVYDALQPLALAKVFDRGELWHHARRRSFGLFAGTAWSVSERLDADLGGFGFHNHPFQWAE